jgi:fucose permease
VGALFGPLLVPFSHHFHVSLSSAGESLSVYFFGAVLGVVPGWQGLRKSTGRRVLTSALITLALGLLLSSFATSWWWFLAGVGLIGLAFGVLDISLNSLLSRSAPVGRTKRLSIGNAGYGLGSVLAPVILILVHPSNFGGVFIGLGVVALTFAVGLRGLHAPAQGDDPLQAEAKNRVDRRLIMWTFAFAFAVYVCLETSASGWMAAQVEGWHYSTTVGSWVTAGFWTGMTISRASGTWLHRRFGTAPLLLGCLVGALGDIGLSAVRPLALVTYPILGIFLGSVFPMGIIWYTELNPHDADGIGSLMLATMVGGTLGPALVSASVSRISVQVVPALLALYGVAALALFWSALRFRGPVHA